MRLRYFVHVLAICSIIGCGKREEPATETNSESPAIQLAAPEVTSLALASKVDQEYNPANKTTTFAAMDTVWAITDVENIPAGAVIEAHWKYISANEAINTNRVTITESGNQHLPFFIANKEGWPTGEYRVDIAINGTVMKGQTFTVKE